MPRLRGFEQHQHAGMSRRDVVLKLQIPVDRDEHLESVFAHAREEPAVARAVPADIGDMCDVAVLEVALAATGNARIEKNALVRG